MNLLWTICFWSALGLLAHAYLGYPLALWLMARCFGRMKDEGSGSGLPHPASRFPIADTRDPLPSLSLLIPAYNEQEVMVEKLRNCRQLQYPGKLEILLGSDGSTDATVELARRQALPNLRVFDFQLREGKASVLNRLAQSAQGEILVFSDANSIYQQDALGWLAAGFADPQVGCVSGRLRLIDQQTGPGGRGEGLYWRYETALKRLESRLGMLIGANGAIYAIRRELFAGIPPGTINDDFFLSVKALEQGCRCLYQPEAEATERTAASLAGEYRRHLRDAAGHFQVLSLTWRLLDPRRGRVAFGYLSHRVLRWFAPFLLGAMLLASGMLAGDPLYRAALLIQAAGYELALMGYLGTRLRLRIGPLFIPLYLAMLHLALLMGLLRHLAGRQPAAWIPERSRGG